MTAFFIPLKFFDRRYIVKKILSLFICIILSASFLMCAVSAEETTGSDNGSVQYDVNFKRDFSTEYFSYGDVEFAYRLYLPRDYSDDGSYPVIVTLCGYNGDPGNTIPDTVPPLFLSDNKEAYNSIILIPICPEGSGWGNGGYGEERRESKALVELIYNLESRYPAIDRARIYAVGLSMGGYGVWDLLIRHNDVFAAGIPICAGADVSKAAILKDTPIYTFHGAEDNVVHPDNTRNMVKAIRAAGGDKIIYVEYEDGGHAIWNRAMKTEGLLDWMFEQKLTDRYPDILTADTKAPETEPSGSDTSSDTAAQTTAAARTEVQYTGIDGADDDRTPDTEKAPISNTVFAVLTIIPLVLIIAVIVLIIMKKRSEKNQTR